MSSGTLAMRVRREPGGTAVITVTGEIDIAAVGARTVLPLGVGRVPARPRRPPPPPPPSTRQILAANLSVELQTVVSRFKLE